MRRILHLRTRPEDKLGEELAAVQRAQPDCEVKVVELTVPAPDYDALLEEVFAADSIQVW